MSTGVMTMMENPTELDDPKLWKLTDSKMATR